MLTRFAPLLLACGCSSMNHTETGALAGGAVGAGVGALAGAACHNPGAGAAIGAGAGAVTGGLIGHSMDKSEEKVKDQAVAAIQAQQQQQQLGINDAARMAQQHVSDEVIIQQIRTGGVVYHLTAPDIEFLKSNGVSYAVILEMQATASRSCASDAPPVEPVYVVRPARPPVAVGFRFGYWR